MPRVELLRCGVRSLVALSLGVAIIAGCGSGAKDNEGLQTLLVGLPTALSSAHSFRMSVVGTVHDDGRTPYSFQGAGVVDWTSGRTKLQIADAGQTFQLIIIGRATYVSRASAVADGGATWVRVGAAANQPALGGLLDLLGDPLTTLSSLSDHLVGVTSKGKTSVGGVPTTELTGRLRTWGPGVVGGITVWIDQHGRIRQLHLTGAGDGRSTDVTEQFSDFGVAVHVVAPPANEVIAMLPQGSKGPDLRGGQLNTCRGFLASPAATRLADATTVLNTLRGTRSANRRPASVQLRTAFTKAATNACARRPGQSWSLVIDQVYLDNQHTYDR